MSRGSRSGQTPDNFYQRGDRHAIFLNHALGRATVCVADEAPTAQASYQVLTVPAVTAPVRDGRGRYPALPLVFEL